MHIQMKFIAGFLRLERTKYIGKIGQHGKKDARILYYQPHRALASGLSR